MKKPDLLNHYDTLLNQAVKDTGINLNLARPFKLTSIDLISLQKERRWTASTILSRYEKKNNIPHSLQGGPAIQLDTANSLMTITSLFSQSDLYLPSVSYLLDYKTQKWFTVKVELSSRQYSEKIEQFDCGDSLLFPVATLTYKFLEVNELTSLETEQAKKYFNHCWISGQNPQYPELNSWIRGQFRRENQSGSLQSQLEAISQKSESLLQSLLKNKAA